MLARLSEPSVYCSLLDALLISPVTKPSPQVIGPSRKSASALEFPESKRYCPSGAWLAFRTHKKLVSPSKPVSVDHMLEAVCLLWFSAQGHQPQTLLVSPLCRTNRHSGRWCLCKPTVLSKGFLTGIRPLRCMVLFVSHHKPL